MATSGDMIHRAFCAVFNEKARQRTEAVIIVLAIAGFFTHLGLVALQNVFGVHISDDPALQSGIAAIYTPFSFILIYEVFLLIYYLPTSFTAAVAKQYEVISLLIARDIFHDISETERGAGWMTSADNLYLVIDAVGLLIVFYGVYKFHQLRHKAPKLEHNEKIDRFIRVKQAMALALLPAVVVMLAWSTGDWMFSAVTGDSVGIEMFKDIDRVFYDGFFKLLIIVDVLILLMSYPFTTSYAQVMRNTGFVITTVLLRLSFTSAPGLDILLVVGAVIFALLTLAVYNRIEPLGEPKDAMTKPCD